MPTTDAFIAAKCTELHSHLLDAKQKFERAALGSSNDYLCALEVIEEMKHYVLYDCLNYEEEESHAH